MSTSFDWEAVWAQERLLSRLAESLRSSPLPDGSVPPLPVGASPLIDGGYRIDFDDGTSRPATQDEVDEAQAWAAQKMSVPESITMAQARKALALKGLLQSVFAALDAMPEPDRTLAKIDFEFQVAVHRDNQLVAGLAKALSLSEADVDDLFRLGATLP